MGVLETFFDPTGSGDLGTRLALKVPCLRPPLARTHCYPTLDRGGLELCALLDDERLLSALKLRGLHAASPCAAEDICAGKSNCEWSKIQVAE